MTSWRMFTQSSVMNAPSTLVLPRKWNFSTGWSGSRPMRMAFSTLRYWPNAPPMKICSTSARSTPTEVQSTSNPA